MAERENFQVHDGGGDGCFLPLIFSDQIMTLDMENSLTHYTTTSSLSTQNNNNMLCFGNNSETVRTDDSSSCNDNNPKTNKRRNEPANFPVVRDGAPAESSGRCKRRKTENPTSKTGHAKVRKEKVGERIIALQQLVSPYGKTDTASVLHEAKGYIKFLHDQVQVLCSPYLQSFPSSSSPHHQHQHDLLESGEMKDLRSRGLCLVPVSCTVHVANTNGADFWSSATPKKSSNSTAVVAEQQ